MIVFFAGAKPPTKAHPWDDPRIAADADLHVMTTFFELKKMSAKKSKNFMRTMGSKDAFRKQRPAGKKKRKRAD